MSVQTRVTAAEFDKFLALHASTDRHFELIRGEIVEKMPTQTHAHVAAMLTGFLFVYLRANPIGYVLVEARYRLTADDENDLIPDLSYVPKTRGALVSRGPALYMPDLAIEIQSDGQSTRFMPDKALLYLEHGTQAVWNLYPGRGLAEVLTPTDRQLLTLDDLLLDERLLPGFAVRVGDVLAASS
ncbi:MAG: Uma2 family endonuclease [Chloroflexota bacterium]|nr:Uma2 family endonuclease [Chloroflexota bacterium]